MKQDFMPILLKFSIAIWSR